MGTRVAQRALLLGLLAIVSLVAAQVASPPRRTVNFDGSSTAKLILQARGEGVQIFVCTSDASWVWKLKEPEATLYDEEHHVIGKHSAGPTWRLNDGSEVQGKVLESRPREGTIP